MNAERPTPSRALLERYAELMQAHGLDLSHTGVFDVFVENWVLFRLPNANPEVGHTWHCAGDEIDKFGGGRAGRVSTAVLFVSEDGSAVRTRTRWYSLGEEASGFDKLSSEAQYWLEFYVQREGLSMIDVAIERNAKRFLSDAWPVIERKRSSSRP